MLDDKNKFKCSQEFVIHEKSPLKCSKWEENNALSWNIHKS